MTVRAALAHTADYLQQHGVPDARVDAEWLVSHALGSTRSRLALELDGELGPAQEATLRELTERRARREPLAYVLGEWGFRRLTLKTDERALVPRPETEAVVERCLAVLAARDAPRVLDVGVGSGAIALAIADEHPGAVVRAIDNSAAALALARENAELTGLADRVELVERDVEDGLPAGPYDLVVANPPYVRKAELDALEPEVRDWEPRGALVGGQGPVDVAAAARAVLMPGGGIVLEVGDGQAPPVAAAVRELGYDAVTITEDLAGRERVVEGRWQ